MGTALTMFLGARKRFYGIQYWTNPVDTNWKGRAGPRRGKFYA